MRKARVGPWYDEFTKRLSQALDEKGMTGAEIAERLHVDEATVSRWKSGQVPEPDIMPRLAAFVGRSIEQLYGVRHGVTTDAAPALEIEGREYRALGLSRRAGAGGPIQNHDDPEALRLAFRAEWLREVCGTSEVTDEHAFLAEVDGDSMEPTLRNGAVVLARRWKGRFENGAIYVVKEDLTADESGLVVKRLTLDKRAEALIVRSDNAGYDPYVIPVRGIEIQAIVLGRVVWVSQQIEGESKIVTAAGIAARALGRKAGRLRNIRRQPDIGDVVRYDEDDESCEDVVL